MTKKAKKAEQVQYLTPRQLRDAANAPRCSSHHDNPWPGDSYPAEPWCPDDFVTVWVDHPTYGLSIAVKRVGQ